MPAPLAALGTAVVTAAATGAATAATGAAAAAGAAAVNLAVTHGPGVARAVAGRFKTRVTDDLGHLQNLARGPLHSARIYGRMGITPAAVERLAWQASQCGSRVERCPCQQRSTFHAEAVDLVRHRASERLTWKEPQPTDAPAQKIGGRLKADVKAIWHSMARNLYTSGDLTSLAVREGLQNSVDAIVEAIKRGQVTTGRFDVTYDASQKILTLADNGIGMSYAETADGTELDPECTLAAFLTLAKTGKSKEEDSGGGFGLAKAVILGAAPNGLWTLHTRDKLVRSTPDSATTDYVIEDAPMRQGTLITLYGVPDDKARSIMLNSSAATVDRIKYTLALCDTPDVELRLNGVRILPTFPHDGGRPISYEWPWGEKITARVRRFDRTDNSQGAVWVRIASGKRNYLLQWSQVGSRPAQTWDIVVDLNIKIRPKNPEYPIKGSRDGFIDSTPAATAFRALIRAQEQQAEAATTTEWSIIEPDEDADNSDELAAWADDPQIKAALDGIEGVIDDYYREAHKVHGSLDAPADAVSDAPGGAAEEDREAGLEASGADRVPVPRRKLGAAAIDDNASARDVGSALRELVTGGSGDLSEVAYGVERAIEQLERGQSITEHTADAVFEALEKRADDEGIVGQMTIARVGEALSRHVASVYSNTGAAEAKKRAQKLNPFGRILIKISNQHYDHVMTDENGKTLLDRQGRPKYDTKRSRKFMRRYKRYLPHLIAWDMTVRLIHKTVEFSIPVSTGFVLDGTARGLCTFERGKSWVLLNPESLEAYIESHRKDPLSIAAFLHGVASHEIAHVYNIRGYGDGHDQEWAKHREDIGFATMQLLEPIMLGVMKLFKLKDPNRRRGMIQRLRNRVQELEAAVARPVGTPPDGQSERWLATSDRLRHALYEVIVARDFAEFVDSPLGASLLDDIEIPGIGQGVDAFRELLLRDPTLVIDEIRRAS